MNVLSGVSDRPHHNWWWVLFLLPVAVIIVIAAVVGGARGGTTPEPPTSTLTASPTSNTDDNPDAEPPSVANEKEAFRERVFAFEAAYYTLDFDTKAAVYEQLTSEEYRQGHLDKAATDGLPGVDGITARVLAHSSFVSAETEGDIRNVWTKVVIQTFRDGELVQGAFEVREAHTTVWQLIDGEWLVISEGDTVS